MLGTFFDFLLVVLGFSSIVVIHEFGHFLAARWAGVRVLAFAVGFGPALVSFRKGLGVRLGSSEREYARRSSIGEPGNISPTEYRINALPFGGYVKMLGQEDLDPTATSGASDSFQNCIPWKKMVIISAGVVFNVIAAALLFIVVFMAGLTTEAPKIGGVGPDSAAATTMASNAAELGIVEPGLKPGDRVLRVAGREAKSFNDIVLAGAMARPSRPIDLTVERSGVAQPLRFSIVPQVARTTAMLEIGVNPAQSPVLRSARGGAEMTAWVEAMQSIGLAGVQPGMRLTRAGAITEVSEASALTTAAKESKGQPFEVEFVDLAGDKVLRTIDPVPLFEVDLVRRAGGKLAAVEHLLGFLPVLAVGAADEDSRAFGLGLRTGDIFVRLGAIEFPSVPEGMSEIQAAKGNPIAVVVLRKDGAGAWNEVTLPGVTVTGKGTIGFLTADSSDTHVLLAASPAHFARAGSQADSAKAESPAATLALGPGSSILSVNGAAISNFEELRTQLRRIVTDGDRTLKFEVRPPSGGTRSAEMTLTDEQAARVTALSWRVPFGLEIFEPEMTILKAANPAEAVLMGLAETRRTMLSTYVTFARLFEGSIKVEHLKGPVGIAHVGTIVAGKGLVWLLFFLALISINLAVINFLPLPIVDGGQFLLIVYEQIRGRPAPVGFQNVVTLAGLVVIGSLFLIVTYNDIRNLIGI